MSHQVEISPNATAAEAVEAWRQPAGVRRRTVAWTDPRDGAFLAFSRGGLDHLRAIAAGEAPPPPVALLLGFAPTEIDEGRVVFETVPGEHQYNPIGAVHGGVIATLLDSAMGTAVHSTLPAGVAYTTTDLQVRYLRPVLAGVGRLRCTGTIVHRGRRTATAEGELRDETGRLYAHATSACLLFDVAEAARIAS